jgi:hypothetical protein
VVAYLGHPLGTSNSYIYPLRAEHTTPLTCTLDLIILSEIGEPLAHCLMVYHLVELVGRFELVKILLLLVFADT